MTKAAMDAAIAAALVGVDIPATGDLCATLAAAKPNWLLLNGQTIGSVTSPAAFANANAHALFTLLWNINGATWPVLPTRGLVSADDDWNTGHIIAIPDARGCAIGMLDLAAGVNSLIALLGIKVGAQNHALVVEEMPPHTHGLDPVTRFWTEFPTSSDVAGFTSGGPAGWSNVIPKSQGGAEVATATAASTNGTTTLTVGGTLTGLFAPGQALFGNGVNLNIWPTSGGIRTVRIVSQLSGPTGGAGTYQLDTACQASGPGLLHAYAANPVSLVQPTLGANIFIRL
jgi:hypothetical protein